MKGTFKEKRYSKQQTLNVLTGKESKKHNKSNACDADDDGRDENAIITCKSGVGGLEKLRGIFF